MDDCKLLGWANAEHHRDTMAGLLARLSALPDDVNAELRRDWLRLPNLPSVPEVEEFERDLTAVEAEYLTALPDGGSL